MGKSQKTCVPGQGGWIPPPRTMKGLALSPQGGTWPPKSCVRTIILLNTTYSNQTLLQILNLDLIKHLDLRLLPNSPGLDLFPRTKVSLYSIME